jgi:fatty acid desaturase
VGVRDGVKGDATPVAPWAGPVPGCQDCAVTAAGARFLRYRSDAPAAALALGAAGWMVCGATGVLPLWSIVVLPFALRWVGIIQHNHTHVPIFRHRALNRAVDVALTFASSVPQPLYRHLHVDVHHRFENTAEDWTGPFYRAGTSFPDLPVSFRRYCLTTTWRCWRRGIPTVWQRQRSALLVCCVPAASPVRVAVFVLVPWAATTVFLPATNWMQHAGCTYESPSSSANVNFGLLHGVLAFNICYHSAHHVRPGAHWSRLPDLHTRFIAPSLPRSRISRGLFLEALGIATGRSTEAARSVGAAADGLLVGDRRERPSDGGEQREGRRVDVDPLAAHAFE